VSEQINIFAKQYELIKGSREVVFQYCEKFSADDYVKEVEGFGRGSIRSTQAHIGRSYIFWLADFGMKKEISYPAYDSYKNLIAVRQLFENVDHIVSEFLDRFAGNMDEHISGKVSQVNKDITVIAIQLFTHVITHEFHHKGQIMSMGRLLDYVPPDADIIRFS